MKIERRVFDIHGPGGRGSGPLMMHA
jgi:hypothetical protein